MITMRRLFYIVLITLAFFIVGCLMLKQWVEALPIAVIGGCLGWALTEFSRETRNNP